MKTEIRMTSSSLFNVLVLNLGLVLLFNLKSRAAQGKPSGGRPRPFLRSAAQARRSELWLPALRAELGQEKRR
jgi:hypothetical protein